MNVLGSTTQKRASAALIAIFGLLLHMVWDTVTVPLSVDSNSRTTLTSPQKQLLASLKSARARAIRSGIPTLISVEDFSETHKAEIALITEPANLAGSSDKNRTDGDTTADECLGCLSNYDPLTGLANALDNEQLTRAEDRIVYLPPISDPKWSRAHMLFNIRAPPQNC